MLELRQGCENCNRPLPPDSLEAMICSYECTFCRACVEEVLHNVCPNCGGGFCQRPIRPALNLRNNNYLVAHPPSEKVVYKPVDKKQHDEFATAIKKIPAQRR